MFFLQVDGDTDTIPVRQDFKNVVDQHIDYIKQNAGQENNSQSLPNGNAVQMNGHIPNTVSNNINNNNLETEAIDTISKRVQQVGNGVAHTVANGVNHMANGVTQITNSINNVANGHGPMRVTPVGKPTNYADLDMQRRENIRNMYSEINHI